MVKHTQTNGCQQATNCLSVFDHFVGLVLKGLNCILLVDAHQEIVADREKVIDLFSDKNRGHF